MAPVIVLTIVHWALLGATASTIGRSSDDHRALACLAVMVLPFNCLLFAAENLVFLVFPMRPAAVGPGDFQVLGRQIVTHALRAIIVAIGAGVAVGIGAVAYRAAHKSLPALAMVSAALLLLEAAALLPPMALAFARFDPSRHTPRREAGNAQIAPCAKRKTSGRPCRREFVDQRQGSRAERVLPYGWDKNY